MSNFQLNLDSLRATLDEHRDKLDRFTEYNHVCLAGEDEPFIERYIKPTYEAEQLPQVWDEHPNLAEVCV